MKKINKYKFSRKDYSIKGYFHFDYPEHISKVESYVKNPNKIALHSFFPLIGYKQEREKYTVNISEYTDGRPYKPASRPIKYAGHLDGYIYKYYANQLNCFYNEWASENGIDDSSIAYRGNKNGKSNIDFAAEVINYIAKQEEAYILVGDFKGYFDSLNHHLLKKRIKEVLLTDYLANDWYNVFKSVTKYGYIDKNIIEDYFGIEAFLRQQGYKKFTSIDKSLSDFRILHKIKSNESKKGIPQGVPISAVMANVYAMNFDWKINSLVEKSNGLYRRYSDDFIIVIPKSLKGNSEEQFQTIVDTVYQLASENELIIAEEKTHKYRKISEQIFEMSKNTSSKTCKIDYLGFVYDGKTVTVRQKSIERFYTRMRKFVKLMQRKKTYNNKNWNKSVMKKIPHRNYIYGLFTDRGFKLENGSQKSNFIEYVKRSQRTFDKVSPNTENAMLNQIKNRKKKLEKLLGKKIYVKQIDN
ncbi:reverse transcriptase/maturase family protein [Alkalibacterium sp. s-m-22]